MSLIYTLYYQEIDPDNIRSQPKREEEITSYSKLVGDTLDIVLDNTDPELYDPNVQGSIFYGTNWRDQPAEIYDDVLGIYIWKGIIKNISTNGDNRTLTVETANYLWELGQKTCVINSTGDVTPAEIIYNILAAEIPAENINIGSFQDAINIQTAASAYAKCVVTLDDNLKCLEVIDRLRAMSLCDVYAVDNVIYAWQYRKWEGQLGFEIKKRDLLGGFSDTHTDDPYYDNYSIMYDSSGTAAQKTKAGGGTNVFVIPEDTIDETTSSSFPILYKSATAAEWAGELALTRYGHLRKTATFKLGDPFKFLRLGDQADLTLHSFYHEPTRITKLSLDRDQHEIEAEVEFLNLPSQVIERDIVPPASPELITLLGASNGSVMVKWSVNTETDLAGYNIYFTTTKGEWEQEQSSLGQSPVEVKNPTVGADGYNYAIIRELNPGSRYYFRVTAFDTSYNESEYSNSMSCIIPTAAAANQWNLTGNIYLLMSLDDTNAAGGTPPSEYQNIPYEESADLLSPAGIYESQIYYHPAGIGTISWHGYTESSGIDYQLKYSDDGDTWTDWTARQDATGNKTVAINRTYFRIRFLFRAAYWEHSDYIYIKSITEAA